MEACPTCGVPFTASTYGGPAVCRSCVLGFMDILAPEESSPLDDLGDESKIEIIREIGHGSSGTVYLACELDTGREVALKLLNQLTDGDDISGERFKNEIAAITSLDHSHIIPIYRTGQLEGRPYFTMRYLSGGNLTTRMAEFSNPTSAASLISKVARAIHHSHQRCILHRDLKPSNILFDENKEPFVTDFGLAKRSDGDPGLTLTGDLLGTPAYMSPEQASGQSSRVSTATDIFSLGTLLHQLITGRLPFDGKNFHETIEAISTKEVTLTDNHLHRDLRAICLKCLEKNPSQRYQSARLLSHDLDSWLIGEPVVARSPGLIRKSWNRVKKHPALSSFIFFILTLFILIALGVPNVLTSLGKMIAIKSRANNYSYNFDHGMDGWTNLRTTNEDTHSFQHTIHGGDILPLYPGDGSICSLGDSDGEQPHDSAIYARSPTFLLPPDQATKISFALIGGQSQNAPSHDQAPSLHSPSTEQGWMGLALRRVSDGHFILTTNRDFDWRGTAQDFIWDEERLRTATRSDAPDEQYTLDLIDTRHGELGWIGLLHLDITPHLTPSADE